MQRTRAGEAEGTWGLHSTQPRRPSPLLWAPAPQTWPEEGVHGSRIPEERWPGFPLRNSETRTGEVRGTWRLVQIGVGLGSPWSFVFLSPAPEPLELAEVGTLLLWKLPGRCSWPWTPPLQGSSGCSALGGGGLLCSRWLWGRVKTVGKPPQKDTPSRACLQNLPV